MVARLMRVASVALAFGAASAASADARRDCRQAVCLVVTEQAQAVRFGIESASPAPVRVTLEPRDLDNMTSDPPAPIELWLASANSDAPERATLATFRVVDPARRHEYHYRWRLFLGAPALHDDSVRYRMPFGGDAPRKLSQGPNSRYSHRGRLGFAFDFPMPEGVPILAARDGVVAEVRDGSTEGGPHKGLRDKANRVHVLHADGTFGEYAHLRKGIAVAVGESVRAGDRLGASGNTGYSTRPHLHFHVWRRAEDGARETVEIRFDAGGAGFVPVAGSYYPPQAEQQRSPE